MNVYGRGYFCQDAYTLSVWKLAVHVSSSSSRDRIVVSTLRCGRNNPGSNPGHGTFPFFLTMQYYQFLLFVNFSFFPDFKKTSNFAICDLFQFFAFLNLPRSYLVIMYLFGSLFITEKLYYFKVQFYWYLKEILSKENGNDLKIWPRQTDLFFFLIIAGKLFEN